MLTSAPALGAAASDGLEIGVDGSLFWVVGDMPFFDDKAPTKAIKITNRTTIPRHPRIISVFTKKLANPESLADRKRSFHSIRRQNN